MEKTKTLITYTLIIIITMSMVMCSSKDSPMTIYYSDQNNNLYSVTENSFNYTPIKPKESSSGTYSGGDSVSKEISSAIFSEISKIATKLLEVNKDNDIKREMMTSRLTLKKGDSRTTVTLRKSESRTSFEALLVALK